MRLSLLFILLFSLYWTALLICCVMSEVDPVHINPLWTLDQVLQICPWKHITHIRSWLSPSSFKRSAPMQENSQDQFYISNSVLLILKIAEGSLGVTVPTVQGGDPCDSTLWSFRQLMDTSPSHQETAGSPGFPGGIWWVCSNPLIVR